jgi:predicted membrane channel-forming protein YqfA (hemolysin III family)
MWSTNSNRYTSCINASFLPCISAHVVHMTIMRTKHVRAFECVNYYAIWSLLTTTTTTT